MVDVINPEIVAPSEDEEAQLQEVFEKPSLTNDPPPEADDEFKEKQTDENHIELFNVAPSDDEEPQFQEILEKPSLTNDPTPETDHEFKEKQSEENNIELIKDQVQEITENESTEYNQNEVKEATQEENDDLKLFEEMLEDPKKKPSLDTHSVKSEHQEATQEENDDLKLLEELLEDPEKKPSLDTHSVRSEHQEATLLSRENDDFKLFEELLEDPERKRSLDTQSVKFEFLDNVVKKEAASPPFSLRRFFEDKETDTKSEVIERPTEERKTSGPFLTKIAPETRASGELAAVLDSFAVHATGSFATFGSKPSSPSETIKRTSLPSLLDVQNEEEPKIDRNIYYELYTLYKTKQNQEKMKNNFLQAKAAEYFTRRKMYHVLHSAKSAQENKRQYEKILDEFESHYERCVREQTGLENETVLLRNQCAHQKVMLDGLFEKLQKEELDYSRDLINTVNEVTKVNTEKIIQHHLKNQRLSVANLSKMRMNYIKLRNKCNDAQDAIDALDNLGSNLHLIDYEELKHEQLVLMDKLEEKELSLTGLRQKCKDLMQILAHTREKLAAINVQIDYYNERLAEVTDEWVDIREQVTQLNLERDRYRRLIQKTREQIGLLGRPKLLRHMSKALMEVEEGRKELEYYKEEYQSLSSQLRKLQKGSSTSFFWPSTGLNKSFEKPKYVNPRKISFAGGALRKSEQMRGSIR